MTEPPDTSATAAELRVVVGQLVRRFREDRTLPQPQLGALLWIWRQGPKTTSQLAALERVRPQSMAATVAQAEAAGLVARTPDPADGRQSLVALTAAGQGALDDYVRKGESWVSEAIAQRLTAAERVELARGLELMSRLVDH